MSAKNNQLAVKSHIGRDLLQCAALFKTDKHVVWEYVSNSLQYVDSNVSPIVHVKINNRGKKIMIKDNGTGMDWEDLDNFFTMHGENKDRKLGRPGRGYFGTGKSAAFGIADMLRITTVRARKKSIVELSRKKVEEITSGDEIPVDVLQREVACDEPNGTLVEIEDVRLPSFDVPKIRHFIERNMGHMRKDVTIYVDNRECEYSEPAVSIVRDFTAEGDVAKALGPVNLVVKVAKGPLSQEERGIQIWSRGQLLETTLAEAENKDMAQFLFGEIDVPPLYEDNTSVAAFDMSRSMKLNPNNPLVRKTYAFIGQKLEDVRRELVDEEKQRKADQEAKRLAKQANEIAQMLNEDFSDFRRQLAKVRAKANGGSDNSMKSEAASDGEEDILFGSEVPAEITADEGGPGSEGGHGGNGDEPRTLKPLVTESPDGKTQGRKAGGSSGKNRKPRGGFSVEFRHLGEADRAKYNRDERTIYINLDHPQLVAALGGGLPEDVQFRRLAYEIAITEYAIALASEMAIRELVIDALEAVDEVREAIMRLALRAAAIYR